jgi:hypothetical protein
MYLIEKGVAMRNVMIMTIVAVLIMVNGCSVSVSGGVSSDWFYPDIRTKDGGGFGDPATSRHETTRATTSHIRNNDGASGNKVDAALRNFFKTK